MFWKIITALSLVVSVAVAQTDTPTNTPTRTFTPTSTSTPTVDCSLSGGTGISIPIAASGDDVTTYGSSSTYGSIVCTDVFSAGTGCEFARSFDGNFYIEQCDLRYNTGAAIPAGDVVVAGDLRVSLTGNLAFVDSRNLIANYRTDHSPISCTDWTFNPAGTPAFSAALSSLSVGSAVFPLSNVSQINMSGYTAFRLAVDGTQPTGKNQFDIKTFETGSFVSVLELCVAPPTPSPTVMPTGTELPTPTVPAGCTMQEFVIANMNDDAYALGANGPYPHTFSGCVSNNNGGSVDTNRAVGQTYNDLFQWDTSSLADNAYTPWCAFRFWLPGTAVYYDGTPWILGEYFDWGGTCDASDYLATQTTNPNAFGEKSDTIYTNFGNPATSFQGPAFERDIVMENCNLISRTGYTRLRVMTSEDGLTIPPTHSLNEFGICTQEGLNAGNCVGGGRAAQLLVEVCNSPTPTSIAPTATPTPFPLTPVSCCQGISGCSNIVCDNVGNINIGYVCGGGGVCAPPTPIGTPTPRTAQLPSISTTIGTTAAFLVHITGGTGAYRFGFKFEYDASIIVVNSVSLQPYSSNCTLSQTIFNGIPGSVSAYLQCYSPLSADGDLLYVNFTAVGDGTSNLIWDYFVLDDGAQADPAQTNGDVIVSGPTETPTTTFTVTRTPTVTQTPSPTLTTVATPNEWDAIFLQADTPTPTPSFTITSTPVDTPTVTQTLTSSPTLSPTPTNTPGQVITMTETPGPTSVPTSDLEDVSFFTEDTPTFTPRPSFTPTATKTPTFLTPIPTKTPQICCDCGNDCIAASNGTCPIQCTPIPNAVCL